MTPAIASNEHPDLCAACGGACCRTRPGFEAPERFLNAPDPAAALATALASGLWVLEPHWGVPPSDAIAPDEGQRIIFYPRPATREEHARQRTTSLKEAGTCVYLAETGCTLPFAGRPFMCRTLEPDPAFECESSWTKRDAALAWFFHQGMIAEALRRLGLPWPEDTPW